MIELVVLDCDGVLFDSAAANVAFYNAVLERLGLPAMSKEWEERVHFLSSAQVYEAMFGAGSRLAAAAHQAAREIGYEACFKLMRPVPGLKEVLAELKAKYRLAMATNRGSTVREIVRRFGLGPYLDLAVGVGDVERPKPYPDMLLHCLRHFGLESSRAVYVGDSRTDYEAARGARMHFIAVGDCEWADWRVGRLEGLPGKLERLAERLRAAPLSGGNGADGLVVEAASAARRETP